MFLLNLLCVLFTSLFNVSSFESEVKVNDFIYQKEDILTKKAFTNDEYTSQITGLTAYRYTNMTYTLGNFGGNNFEGRVSIDNGNYQTVNTTFALDLKSISEVNAYASTTYDTGDDWVTLFAQNTSIAGYNGVIFRFFAPSNSKCENIEFKVSQVEGAWGLGLSYGIGTFNDSSSTVPFTDNPIFLINSSMSLQNNISLSSNTYTRGFRFCDYYFYCIPTSSTSTIKLEVNLLGAFDRDYQSGYNDGYVAGDSTGFTSGYTRGYADGYNEGVSLDTTASTIFTGILDVALVPVNVFLSIFNFEVFGVNISGIVSALLTVSVVIIIFRFVFGGKKDD